MTKDTDQLVRRLRDGNGHTMAERKTMLEAADAIERLSAERGRFESYPAEKVGGSYQAEGTVIGEVVTLDGKPRIVFEFAAPRGMLHIFQPDQIKRKEAT